MPKVNPTIVQKSRPLTAQSSGTLTAKSVNNVTTLRDVLVLGGGAVVISGINVSKEAGIHRAGIEELNQSFSADIDTVVIEFEGKQVELEGTVEEQYRQWRDLLRRLYEEETGFGVDGTTAPL